MKIDEDIGGELIEVNEFKEYCECGGFIDEDGFGHPVINNVVNEDIIIKPSKLKSVPKDATNIVWYNR